MTDHYLFAEINVEWPEPTAYEEMARAWLDRGFGALAGSHRQALEEGPKLPGEAMRRNMPSLSSEGIPALRRGGNPISELLCPAG